jgi:hypothetical protein
VQGSKIDTEELGSRMADRKAELTDRPGDTDR